MSGSSVSRRRTGVDISVEAGDTSGTGGIPAIPPIISVQNNWAYIIRPPRWPLAQTPRERGGVRAQGGATEVQLVLCSDASAERVFFWSAANAAGPVDNCFVDVDARDASVPSTLRIGVNGYVERLMSPTGGSWGPMVARSIDDLAADDPVRLQLNAVIAGGPSGGASS